MIGLSFQASRQIEYKNISLASRQSYQGSITIEIPYSLSSIQPISRSINHHGAADPVGGVTPHHLTGDGLGGSERRACNHHLERPLLDFGREREGVGDHSNVEPRSLHLGIVHAVGGADIGDSTVEDGVDWTVSLLYEVLHAGVVNAVDARVEFASIGAVGLLAGHRLQPDSRIAFFAEEVDVFLRTSVVDEARAESGGWVDHACSCAESTKFIWHQNVPCCMQEDL